MGGTISSPTTAPGTAAGTPNPGDQGSNSSRDPPAQNPDANPRSGGGAGEEEEGECGFCLFMKAGECRDVFIAWENCVAEADMEKEEAASKCSEPSAALFKCMDAHRDYYGRIFDAKEQLEEEATIELEGEMAADDLREKTEPKSEGSDQDLDAKMATKGMEKNAGSESQVSEHK